VYADPTSYRVSSYGLGRALSAGGAFLRLAGNLLWYAALPLHQVVPWWIGFLVLTIAGERLELARLLSLSGRDRLKFLFGTVLFLCGLVLSLVTFVVGVWLSGAGLVALGLRLYVACDRGPPVDALR
jgi:hypothetical protein